MNEELEEEFICSKHIYDKFVKSYIFDHAIRSTCKYCNRITNVIAITDLAAYIEELIAYEFDDPYGRGALYDKEANYYEDRFPGITVVETEALLEDELDVDDWQVIHDISKNINNDYWAEIDSIWGPSKDQYLKGGWEQFKNILKHKIRFLFFNETFKDRFNDEYGESLNPYFILKEVKDAIEELNLFRNYSKGKLHIFRSRQHDTSKIINSAFELGSPPVESAKASRMSPAGISMFYGAFDVTTCEMEIEDNSKSDTIITTGRFTNLIELVLIDFTRLKSIPSLFDQTNRDKRPVSKFLQGFIKDLSIPVKPDESVHIEYIPTQVVTEYLRFFSRKGKGVDGIIYNSVKKDGGKCIVLFFENQDVSDKFSIKAASEILIDELGLSESKRRPDTNASSTMMLENDKIITKCVEYVDEKTNPTKPFQFPEIIF